MPREDSVHDLRDHRVVVANDARKYRTALTQPRHEVLAQLIFYSPGPETLFGERTSAQFAESPAKTHGGTPKENSLMRIILLGDAVSFSVVRYRFSVAQFLHALV